MADNYTLFSEALYLKSKKEREWCRRTLGALEKGKIPKDVHPTEEDWLPGFNWELNENTDYLWLYSEETCHIDNLCDFVQAFLAKFDKDAYWTFSWAETCSSPRIGEFGGAAGIVTADEVGVYRPLDFLRLERQLLEGKTNRGVKTP